MERHTHTHAYGVKLRSDGHVAHDAVTLSPLLPLSFRERDRSPFGSTQTHIHISSNDDEMTMSKQLKCLKPLGEWNNINVNSWHSTREKQNNEMNNACDAATTICVWLTNKAQKQKYDKICYIEKSPTWPTESCANIFSKLNRQDAKNWAADQ